MSWPCLYCSSLCLTRVKPFETKCQSFIISGFGWWRHTDMQLHTVQQSCLWPSRKNQARNNAVGLIHFPDNSQFKFTYFTEHCVCLFFLSGCVQCWRKQNWRVSTQIWQGLDSCPKYSVSSRDVTEKRPSHSGELVRVERALLCLQGS